MGCTPSSHRLPLRLIVIEINGFDFCFDDGCIDYGVTSLKQAQELARQRITNVGDAFTWHQLPPPHIFGVVVPTIFQI